MPQKQCFVFQLSHTVVKTLPATLLGFDIQWKLAVKVTSALAHSDPIGKVTILAEQILYTFYQVELMSINISSTR